MTGGVDLNTDRSSGQREQLQPLEHPKKEQICERVFLHRAAIQTSLKKVWLRIPGWWGLLRCSASRTHWETVSSGARIGQRNYSWRVTGAAGCCVLQKLYAAGLGAAEVSCCRRLSREASGTWKLSPFLFQPLFSETTTALLGETMNAEGPVYPGSRPCSALSLRLHHWGACTVAFWASCVF